MSKFGMFRHSDAKAFAAGDIIFRAGEPRTFMFVINEGEVEIRLADRLLEVASGGGIFGEMAMIDNEPRTATAVARTACKLVLIDQKRFQFLVHETPYFAIEVMRVLADRLRRTNQLVNA